MYFEVPDIKGGTRYTVIPGTPWYVGSMEMVSNDQESYTSKYIRFLQFVKRSVRVRVCTICPAFCTQHVWDAIVLKCDDAIQNVSASHFVSTERLYHISGLR